MFEERKIVDSELSSEERCLGAVFCSYTFDPAYFEDQVLRSILKLASDPDEDGARYHEEARAALRDTPVACIVDASARRPGRRLPYDQILVRERLFHPKLLLVLHESEARLAIGSGNVTKPGLEQNTELYFVRRLKYEDPADTALLRDVDAFLQACVDLTRCESKQLDLARMTLLARVRKTPPLRDADRVDVRFVSSFGGPLIDRLEEEIPKDARITRVGVLAPFFEADDLAAGDDAEGIPSVLASLLSLRRSNEAVLDIGVPWDDAPLGPPNTADPPAIEEHTGAVWAHRFVEKTEDGPVDRLEHFLVEKLTAKRVELRAPDGGARRIDRDEFEAGVEERALWPVPKPTVHAPKRILTRIAAEREVKIWLHPAAELGPSGRPRRRPLHAKLFLATATQRGRTWTHVLAGSANASRAAMLRSVSSGGNVEAGVIFRMDGEAILPAFLPSLVECPLDRVQFEERKVVGTGLDLSAWIEDVAHDARERTLTVTWRETGPEPLGPWVIRYLDEVVLRGDGRPATELIVRDFDLAAASAEVTFATGGGEWAIPIRVVDLIDLPVHAALAKIGLRELLALLGRRLTPERIATLRTARGPAGVNPVLEALFGEGFGPTDVFKALWGMTENLTTAPTISAFRHALSGPTGAERMWELLRDAAGESTSEDEIWVYGCELLRQLRKVNLPDGPDLPTKKTLLKTVVDAIAADLERLAPDAGSRPWLSAVTRFYGIGGRDDVA